MVTLYRRKNSPYWYARLRDPRTDKIIWISTRCTSRREAEKWVRTFIAMREGILPEEKGIKLSEAIQQFLEFKSRTMRSVRRYQSSFKALLRIIGDIPLAQIKPATIRKFQEKRLQEDGPRGPITTQTVNRDVAALSSLFTWAVEREYVTENPCLKVKKLKEPPAREIVLTLEEIQKLLNTPTTSRMKLLFLISLTTGMRMGEVLNIERQDIRDDGSILVRYTKTGRSRIIPVPEVVYHEIKKFLAFHNEPTLFPHRSAGNVKWNWKRWKERAGIRPEIRFHDVRATYATIMAGIVGDPQIVRQLLGHASIQTTERYLRLAGQFGTYIRSAVQNAFSFLMPENYSKNDDSNI